MPLFPTDDAQVCGGAVHPSFVGANAGDVPCVVWAQGLSGQNALYVQAVLSVGASILLDGRSLQATRQTHQFRAMICVFGEKERLTFWLLADHRAGMLPGDDVVEVGIVCGAVDLEVFPDDADVFILIQKHIGRESKL